MKTILWTQNEDAMIKDTFVIDGVVSQADGTEEEVQAFSKLTQASNSLKLTPKSRKILSDLKGFSEQANFSIENKIFYIQGCFIEKDNANRDMPYMFLTTDCESFETAIASLKQTAALIGRHCNEVDLRMISTFVNHDSITIENACKKLEGRQKKNGFKIVFGIVICLIIVLLIIWMFMN